MPDVNDVDDLAIRVSDVDDLAFREKIYREAKDIKVIVSEVQMWSNYGEIDYEELVSKLEGISAICYLLCGDIREYQKEQAAE